MSEPTTQPTPDHLWDLKTMTWKLPGEISELNGAGCPMEITLLDAKWLDPECHAGCQSLVIKNKCEALEKVLGYVVKYGERSGMARVRQVCQMTLDGEKIDDFFRS